MSKSYRDTERRKSREADAAIGTAWSTNKLDDLAQKYAASKDTKTITRYGNNRKTFAKQKVQKRRTERKANNNFDTDY